MHYYNLSPPIGRPNALVHPFFLLAVPLASDGCMVDHHGCTIKRIHTALRFLVSHRIFISSNFHFFMKYTAKGKSPENTTVSVIEPYRITLSTVPTDRCCCCSCAAPFHEGRHQRPPRVEQAFRIPCFVCICKRAFLAETGSRTEKSQTNQVSAGGSDPKVVWAFSTNELGRRPVYLPTPNIRRCLPAS